MKGIPKGLHTDADVRVRPQLLSDEACRGKPVLYGLPCDVAILPMVVFFGRPERGLSCSLPVARCRCLSLEMTEGDTPSCLTTSLMEVFRCSIPRTRPLFSTLNFLLGGMVEQGFTDKTNLLILPSR
jgi:hypothetical protein